MKSSDLHEGVTFAQISIVFVTPEKPAKTPVNFKRSIWNLPV